MKILPTKRIDLRIFEWMVYACLQRPSALRSAWNLKNAQPRTEADRGIKVQVLFICSPAFGLPKLQMIVVSVAKILLVTPC
jgi:hypothetical protein